MLLLFFLVAFIPFVTSLSSFGHLDDAVTRPAFGIRQTFISTPPRQLSGRAVLGILKRQGTCGSGFCGVQDTCCGGRGCCPGGASCCSNGSCCEAGTLCTKDSQGQVGCCPIGQTCSGIETGNDEESNNTGPLTTQTDSSPTSSTSPSPASPTGPSNNTNNQINDKEITTSASQSGLKNSSLPSSGPAMKEVGAGTILGAVIGGILGWLALCGLLLWLLKRRKRQNTANSGQVGTPSPLGHDSRGSSKNRQGVEPGLVGLKIEIPGDLRAPRPYTTLLERDAVKVEVERFANPISLRA